MAHAATLGLLVEGLITSITGSKAHDKSFTTLRDKASRALKDQSNARTNQFAVKASYAGLVEKFQVVNRDALADALQSCLDELPIDETKYMPEVLSLLLLLSDKPAEKSELGSLEKFSQPEIDALTWSSVLADHSHEEEGLWDNIERGYHSSGDEATSFDHNDPDLTTSTQATSVEDEDFISLARLHVVPVDHSLTTELHLAHEYLSRLHDGRTDVVSELMLSREILAMLHGLPTSIFSDDSKTGRVVSGTSLTLATASRSTVASILSQSVELGSRLNSLRIYCRGVEYVDYKQSVKASVQTLLKEFDDSLTTIEERHLHLAVDEAVSLVELWTTVDKAAHSLSYLSTILDDCTAVATIKTNSNSFALLDRLYEEVCLMQLAGDFSKFDALSTIFTAGVCTYLRPVGKWLRQGALPSSNHDTFLICELEENCPLADVWYNRFRLRSTSEGKPAVPSFMQPLTEQILAAGKTTAFMKLLSQDDDRAAVAILDMDNIDMAREPLDSDSKQSIGMLLPYSEFLAEQLRNWLSQTAINSSSDLRKKLWSDHELDQVLKALEYVYFARDGSLFDMFAESLSTRIANSHQAMVSSSERTIYWKDNFILSELAHNTLGLCAYVDAENMTMRCLEQDYSRSASAAGTVTQELSTLALEYRFSWAIQNITREQSPSVHRRALTFLLQIHYAKSRLSVQLLDLRPINKNGLSRSQSIMKALRLRQRLSWFLEILHDHVTSSCLVQHKAMTSRMAIAEGIDDMAFIWTDYAKHLEVSLLIADKLAPVRNSVIKIIELSEQFFDLWTQVATAHELQQSALGLDQAVKQQNIRTTDILQDQFDSSFYFVVAGLRSIGRAGGDSALEILAQRLDTMHG